MRLLLSVSISIQNRSRYLDVYLDALLSFKVTALDGATKRQWCFIKYVMDGPRAYQHSALSAIVIRSVKVRLIRSGGGGVNVKLGNRSYHYWS